MSLVNPCTGCPHHATIEHDGGLLLIAYMSGGADTKDYIRERMRWFLECWELPRPLRDRAYDEAEASLMRAVDELAQAVGIDRPVQHYGSANMNRADK